MSICKQDKGVGTTDVVHSYTKPGRAKFISLRRFRYRVFLGYKNRWSERFWVQNAIRALFFKYRFGYIVSSKANIKSEAGK